MRGAGCAEIFDRYDLLVTPTLPYDPPAARGPFPTETEGRHPLAWRVASFTIPLNLSLHPAEQPWRPEWPIQAWS